MWILVTFAIIALLLFLAMILLKQEPIVSMVVSILTALIVSYFVNHLTITYNETPRSSLNINTNNKDTQASPSVKGPSTSIQSSASSANSNTNSSSYGFFKSC